ncbi:hypothetical protein C0Q70_14131 [Pomacea canaliculata]|uniref:EF-hand domain-containing protein n=1 Tax=Pomacea canaliculata TaxID=400727 RepID=A0A2T7NZ53_POMCA|nr:hypothetical protein C0Q70_14131 [Pomacea canaliculata]
MRIASQGETYLAACRLAGVIPVSCFVKHLHDKDLVVRFRNLGPSEVKAMCDPLKANIQVQTLDLKGNWIQESGCHYVTKMMTDNISLSELVLSENKIGNQGVIALCAVLCRSDMICKLDLSGNSLGDSAAEAICDLLTKNSSLKHLFLKHNRFEQRAAFYFKHALSHNITLETLDLSWNCFSTRSVTLVAKGVQNNTGLRCLNFSMNGVGHDGAQYLGRALRVNRTLQHLDICFGRIPEDGCRYLAASLEINDVLQGLKISNNPIGSDGAMDLLMAVARNNASSITYLEMSVSETFRKLELRMKDARTFNIVHAGYKRKAGPSEGQKSETGDWWVRDPMTKLRNYMKENGYRLIDLFRDFDKDSNNTISREEFIIGVEQAGINLTEGQIDDLIKRLDKDKSGTVDFWELLEGDREHRILYKKWMERKKRMSRKASDVVITSRSKAAHREAPKADTPHTVINLFSDGQMTSA